MSYKNRLAIAVGTALLAGGITALQAADNSTTQGLDRATARVTGNLEKNPEPANYGLSNARERLERNRERLETREAGREIEREDRAERSEKAERREVERVEKHERPERAERIERPERVERAERVERPEKVERGEHS